MTALTHNAKPWISSLHTYQPGRPIEDVARELGIEDVRLRKRFAECVALLDP